MAFGRKLVLIYWTYKQKCKTTKYIPVSNQVRLHYLQLILKRSTYISSGFSYEQKRKFFQMQFHGQHKTMYIANTHMTPHFSSVNQEDTFSFQSPFFRSKLTKLKRINEQKQHGNIVWIYHIRSGLIVTLKLNVLKHFVLFKEISKTIWNKTSVENSRIQSFFAIV